MRNTGRNTGRDLLKVNRDALESIDAFLNSENPVTDGLLAVIEKHGGVEEINRKARAAGVLKVQVDKLRDINSPYVKDLEWLAEQLDNKSFISLEDYYRKVLGDRYGSVTFDQSNAVTLEISALQFFPWMISQARQAIEQGELMPGRYIRVRSMKESESDNGDLLAVSAAMNIVGATWVETLDTRGTDGANVHLGGPDTITGYFGGPGQPNDYALKWVDEFLYYHTNYGVREVLNLNPGTVLLGYLLYKLGVDIKFKISVFMGNDNPYSVLWTLMTAKLFSQADGTTPLIGFNFSNSVNNETIELSAVSRGALGFEDKVRFEHHITETWKSIVRQPYDRTDELPEVAKRVKNISAKHEGGGPELDSKRDHPSDIMDYFKTKEEILAGGLMEKMELNYLDKHAALNRTARVLTGNGIAVIPAWNLHRLQTGEGCACKCGCAGA